MADAVLNTDDFNNGIDRLLKVLEKLDKRIEENVNQAQSFEKMFKTEAVDNFINSIKNVDKASSDSFKTIADGISKIADAVFRLNQAEESKTGSSIASIIKTIEIISNISSSDESAKFAKTIDRISIALIRFNKLINDSANGIKPGTVRKIAIVYGSFGLVLKVLSAALSHVPGGQEADKLSRVFDRVGRAIRAIGTVDKVANFKTLFNLAKVITALALSLRVASKTAGNSERLKGFGTALSGIGNFFKNFSADADKQTKSLKIFQSNVKIIRKTLSDLNKIKVNPQKAESIARQLEALQKIQTGSSGGSGPTFLQRFASELSANLASTAIVSAIGGIKKLSSAISSLGKDGSKYIQQIGQSIKQVGRQAIDFSKNLINNFGIGKLIQSSAVQSAAGFEKISSMLVTFGNLTADQVKKAQSFANEIGIKYPLSANEALDATLNLIKAGRSLQDVQFILPGAADLAALSDSKSIDAATRFLISAANGYERFSKTAVGSFENVSVAADTVFAAANKSTASIDSLYEGLSRAAPAANSFGLTLEETAAFLTQFEDAEIRGTEAGTALRTVLNGLSKSNAKSELAKLGIATQTADGKVRSLNEVIKDLRSRYEELGYTQVQINSSIAEFGDTFAQQGIKILLARGGIDEVLEGMNSVQPASEAAVQSLENFSGQVEQLTGSFQTLLTKVALPLLSRFFTPLVKVIRSVVDFLLKLPDPILETVGNMIFLGSAIATVVGGFIALNGALLIISGSFISLVGVIGRIIFSAPLIISAFASMAASLVVMAPLIIAIVGGFTALSATVTHAFRSIENNVDGAGDAFNKFKGSMSGVLSEVSSVFSEAGKIVRRFFGSVESGTSSGSASKVTSFFEKLSEKADALKNVISEAKQGLEAFNFFLSGTGTASAFSRYEGLLKNLAKTDLAKAIFGSGVTAARIDKFFRDTMSVLTRISDAAKDIGAGIAATLFGVGDPSRLLNGVKNALSLITETIQNFTGLNLQDVLLDIENGDFIAAAGNFANSLLNAVKNAIVANKDKFVDIITFVLNYALNPFALLEIIASALGADQLANVFGYLGDQLTAFISNTIGSIVDTLGGQSIGEAILGNFGSGAQGIASFFDTIQSVVGKVSDIFSNVFLPIILKIPDAIQNLWNIAQPIFQQFSDFISGPFLAALLETINNQIVPAFGTLADFLVGVWESVSPGLIAFSNFFINEFAPEFTNIIINQLIPVLGEYIGYFVKIFNEIRPPIESFLRWFGGEFIPQIVDVVKTSLLPLFKDILVAGSLLIRALAPLFADFAGFIVSKILPIVQLLAEGFVVGIDFIATKLRLLIRIATPIIIGLAKLFEVTLYPVIKLVIDVIAFFARTFIAGAQEAAKGATALIKFFLNLSDVIFNALQPAFRLGVKLVQLFGKTIELIAAVIRVPLRLIFNLVKSVFERVADFFSGGAASADHVGNVISKIWDKVRGPINDFFNGVSNIFGKVIDFINDIIKNIDKLIDALDTLSFKVNDVNYEIDLSVNTDEAIRQIQNLSEDFNSNDTEIAARANFLFSSGFNKAFEEGGQFAEAYIQELEQLGAAGKLTEEDVRGLTEAIRNAHPVTEESIIKTEEQTKAINDRAQAIINNKDAIREQEKATKDAIREQDQIFGNDIEPQIYEVTVDDTEVQDFRSDLEQLNQDISDGGELSVDMEALQQAKQDYQDELDDIKKDTIKAERNRQKQVTSAEEKIQEIRDDYDRNKIDSEVKFQIETERNLEDHNKKLRDLDRKANDEILDAAIARDAGAARSAVRNAEQAKNAAQEEFDVAEKRRQEDFDLERAKAERERDIKLEEAQKDLEQLRQEQAIEREEERVANEERLAEKKKALDELLSQEQMYSEQREETQRLSNERQSELLNDWVENNEAAVKAIKVKWIEASKFIAGLDTNQAAFTALGTGLNILSQGNLFGQLGGLINTAGGILSGNQSVPTFTIPSAQNSSASQFIPVQQGNMSIPGLVSGNTTTNSQSTNISIEVPIDMSNMQNGTQLDEQALADNVEAQVVKGVTKALAKANYNINTRPLSS